MTLINDSQPDRFLLNRVRLKSQIAVDSYLWQEANVYVHTPEAVFDQVVIGIETAVLQDKLPPREVEETFLIESFPYPVTWWDHFKVTKLGANRWYWRWLRKLKAPELKREESTRTVKIGLDRWINYPEAQNVPPHLGQAYHGYNITRLGLE